MNKHIQYYIGIIISIIMSMPSGYSQTNHATSNDTASEASNIPNNALFEKNQYSADFSTIINPKGAKTYQQPSSYSQFITTLPYGTTIEISKKSIVLENNAWIHITWDTSQTPQYCTTEQKQCPRSVWIWGWDIGHDNQVLLQNYNLNWKKKVSKSMQSLDLSYENKLGNTKYITSLRNIIGLTHLTALESLEIREHHLTDLEGIEQLTNLQYLDVSYNMISNIAQLHKIHNLKIVYLSNNRIDSLVALSAHENLQYVDAMYNAVNDLRDLENNKQLRHLDLSWNNITSLNGLQYLTKLETLIVWHNNITQLHYTENSTQLQKLDIWDNKVRNLSGIQYLKNLRILNINNNYISSLTPLQKLPYIEQLYSAHNDINAWTVPPFQHIRIIDISQNQIQNLTFSEPIPVQIINISANPLINIKGLHNLKKINSLKAYGTQFENMNILLSPLHSYKNTSTSTAPQKNKIP